MNTDNCHSNFSTLFLSVFKEVRINSKINQSFIANYIGKTPSSWTKIENGQAQITFDIFVGACHAMNLQPNYMLSMVDKLTTLFNQRGYFFFYGQDDDDQLLPLIIKFYNSKGFERMAANYNYADYNYKFISILSYNSIYAVPTIVDYCTNKEFQQWFDEGDANSPCPILIPTTNNTW